MIEDTSPFIGECCPILHYESPASIRVCWRDWINHSLVLSLLNKLWAALVHSHLPAAPSASSKIIFSLTYDSLEIFYQTFANLTPAGSVTKRKWVCLSKAYSSFINRRNKQCGFLVKTMPSHFCGASSGALMMLTHIVLAHTTIGWTMKQCVQSLQLKKWRILWEYDYKKSVYRLLTRLRRSRVQLLIRQDDPEALNKRHHREQENHHSIPFTSPIASICLPFPPLCRSLEHVVVRYLDVRLC